MVGWLIGQSVGRSRERRQKNLKQLFFKNKKKYKLFWSVGRLVGRLVDWWVGWSVFVYQHRDEKRLIPYGFCKIKNFAANSLRLVQPIRA